MEEPPETDSSNNSRDKAIVQVIQKVQASLQPAIQTHVETFSSQHGLDFMDVKNSLLLTYLIELTRSMQATNDNNKERLVEMRIVLDKLRGLDKKLKYQIDKLLAAQQSSEFATTTTDPLQLRPQIQMDDGAGSSSEVDEKQQHAHKDDDSDDDDMEQDDDDDDDLAAARQTLANSKQPPPPPAQDAVYKAPRHMAVPYAPDNKKRQQQQERRRRQNSLRSSGEVAETLRHQYGDQPEVDDTLGVGPTTRERTSFTNVQRERTQFEEDHLLRLTVTRKEKQARKRHSREEVSNLNALSNVDKILVLENDEPEAFVGHLDGNSNSSNHHKKKKQKGKRRR